MNKFIIIFFISALQAVLIGCSDSSQPAPTMQPKDQPAQTQSQHSSSFMERAGEAAVAGAAAGTAGTLAHHATNAVVNKVHKVRRARRISRIRARRR